MVYDKRSVLDRSTGSTAVPEPDSEPQRFQLSVGNVAASSLAAASAAAIASVFGVGGTIIGTALFSVVATVATALYEHAGRRTARSLASVAGPLFERPEPPVRPSPRRLPWRRVALGAALAFAIAVAAITAFEYLAGKPLSALWGGRADQGTSVQQVFPHSRTSAPGKPAAPAPAPSPTSGSTDGGATTSPTAPVTATPTSPAATRPSSPGPTGETPPAPTPSVTPTPSSTPTTGPPTAPPTTPPAAG